MNRFSAASLPWICVSRRLSNCITMATLITIFMIFPGCTEVIKIVQPEKKINTEIDNVFIESIDKGSSDPRDDRTIYYKIFLDKEIVAKTTSGLFFQKKKLSIRLTPGRYLFFAERWYLDDSQENEVREYKRANNVWQMKPIYIDIYESVSPIKIVFGIDHDNQEFYSNMEDVEKTVLTPAENKESNR